MKVHSPRTLDDALAALQEATPQTKLLAGGTDLMVELDIGRTQPDRVIDLWRVDELRGIECEPDGLRLGALVTCTELVESELVRDHADLLAQASGDFGATQIRNRATLGGNLGTASPAADLNPALLALGASVRLHSQAGQRDVPASEFLTGYREHAGQAHELIGSVWIPARPDNERRGFRKVGTRRAQSISKVVVALALCGTRERVESVTAAAGSIAERTLVLPAVADELVGNEPSAERIDRAARRAADEDARPRDDVRSSARYRRETLYRVLRRLLSQVSGELS